jgi:hypothetical protein
MGAIAPVRPTRVRHPAAMPDRYADAVRARRTELRALRARLGGGHRDELRSALALSRLGGSAEITAALAALGAEAATHLERADRADRRRFAARLGQAVEETADRLHTRWAADLRPALLRIARARSLPVRPGWPGLPDPPAPSDRFRLDPPPLPAGRLRSALAGAAHGAALWRLLLVPLLALPIWGLPAVGGRPLVPLAAGTGIAVITAAARSRCVAAERSRWRRYADDVLAAARLRWEADLGRRLIEVEVAVAGGLDAAVRQRRAEIEDELARLAPVAAAPAGAPDG